MIIQQGKTNWIFIVIVVLVAAAVSAGSMMYINNTVQQTSVLSQITELNKSAKNQNTLFDQENSQNTELPGNGN